MSTAYWAIGPLKRNQFGGTVGGPVMIPGLFHTQHSFFFVGYQKTIARHRLDKRHSLSFADGSAATAGSNFDQCCPWIDGLQLCLYRESIARDEPRQSWTVLFVRFKRRDFLYRAYPHDFL